ncbi:MAG: hypothetical protein A3C58_00695 [Candidatus Staskawiczbacteria bacterium RIFCSPHIGHO2_02_FULL_34_10]|uniref:Nucleotide pyrophosphohydrolase n=1 Tax=Candidatus Staskawiczbacteria bacterium RIFCSPHIGHO2_02_FULL_34_10 TaxID=1802205 RepID=A0A1G2HWC8_9BACT|nr:MAG: hypothetical protein A3C58_00695 [Candidatus Staskawiczbacteria bacterium RIFCSPHIGHO2_02_FULL_34_10]
MKNIEKAVYQYLKERNWDKNKPSDIAKSICIEAAELLEVFQWGNCNIEETKNNKEKMEEIKKELADVFIYGLNMSVLLGLDTKKIIIEKINYINKKYPASLVKKDNTDNFGFLNNSYYLKIKRRDRINNKKLIKK